MRLDCKIKDRIREEFSALWACSQNGETLEIVTPYLMPDSRLLVLFLTERSERFIVCEGGRIWELHNELGDRPPIEAIADLRALAKAHEMKEGNSNGTPIFYKDCLEEKQVGSIAFDVANFATMAANVLVAIGKDDAEEQPSEKEKRFSTEANEFIVREAMHPGQALLTNHEIEHLPDLRFSAVVVSGLSLWVFSYIGGGTLTTFRKNISDAADSFKEVWDSPMGRRGNVKKTIPLMNSGADGYRPMKLQYRLSKLRQDARTEPVSWAENYQLRGLLAGN